MDCIETVLKKKKDNHDIVTCFGGNFIKVYLTPNFFFAQINFHIMWSKSPQKFFDLLESKYGIRWSKYGKFNKNAAILVHVRVLGAWD